MATADENVTPEPTGSPSEAGPNASPARYEFTKAQEVTIGDLAHKMRFVGVMMFIGAAIAIVNVARVAYATGGKFYADVAIFGMFQLLMGSYTLRASRGFRAVVETTGWDVPHLMGALKSLRDMYGLIYWILVMTIIAMFVLFTNSVVRG